MGGASSKFEETDWDKADGKLIQPDDTVDGAPPTESYGVYFLTKRGISQREYEVTDQESNVLYSTRAVEGTLACFDLLGKGLSDNCLLRVEVDLSRRYWVLYRFGVASFPEQVADMQATMRLGRRRGYAQFLYRKACITVSWSRFHAIVNPYGPSPVVTPDDDDDDENAEIKSNESESRRVSPNQVSSICVQEKNAVVDDSFLPEEEEHGTNRIDESSTENADDAEDFDSAETQQKNGNKSIFTQFSTEMDLEPDGGDAIQSHGTEEKNGTESHLEQPSSANDELAKETSVSQPDIGPETQKSLKKWKTWVKTKASETMEYATTTPYTPEDVNEGVVLLDKPVLKVEEINSFTGQHQTMLIRCEEVEELKESELREEREGPQRVGESQGPNHSECTVSSMPNSRVSSWKDLLRVRSIAKIDQHLAHSGSDLSEGKVKTIASAEGTEGEGLLRAWGGQPRNQGLEATPKIGLAMSADSSDSMGNDMNGGDNADNCKALELHSSNKRRYNENEKIVRNADGQENSSTSPCEAENEPVPVSTEMEMDEREQELENERIAQSDPPSSESKEGSDNSKQPGGNAGDDLESTEEKDQEEVNEQPLVAYWQWENTYRVHKMKMHLAKGADLALHVVLAVVTNQLRYERNAVAVTV